MEHFYQDIMEVNEVIEIAASLMADVFLSLCK